jgi:hypothetical protein
MLKDCTKPVKSAAYTSMVRPTMEHASSVWDPTNRKKISNLEKVITEGLTARSFLMKAIFASSPAVVGLDILVAVYIN